MRRRFQGRARRRPTVEALECRELPATIGVDPSQVVRAVNNQVLGVNLAWWDSNLTTARTKQMVQDAGLTLFRFPGGSSSDEYHFADPPRYNGFNTAPNFAKLIESIGGKGMVTLNYGTGSPQEAAAFLAYLNGSTTNATVLGLGPKWNDSSQSWANADWKTAGYWAGLRAATPLAQDDGLNFLRIGHPAPFGFHYYEIGNEVYGSWETDHHGQGGVGGAPHDPATYVTYAKQFATYASAIDPSISIGIATGSPGQENNWTRNVLTIGAQQGFVPGFLSDHHYMQAPGQENDATLLLNTSSGTGTQDPTNPMNWTARATAYRQLLQQALGSSASNVELLATEFNSVYAGPGKQTTSLVNGLFIADSLGSLLNASYDGANVWGLRNSFETGNNNSSNLYGWRLGGDYGLLGDPNYGAPASGAYTPYPGYFAEQLVARMVHPGDTVIRATSDDPNLAVYSVKQANGHIDLLVINKSASSSITGTFQINGVAPGTQAQAWQYGKAEDTAQSQTTDGHSSLTSFLASLTPSGNGFSYAFPSYSMTLLDISGTSGPPNQAPTIASAASASPAVVTATTTVLSVLGADDGGEPALKYTWTTVGTPPAPVSFSTNGANASKSTTVTFAAAGTYSFLATVTDPGGLSATSTVTVTVNQTATQVAVSPGSASLTTGSTRQFSAQLKDQFGAAMAAQPTFAWAVGGAGSISATGLYSAPATPGSATVRATAGAISGTANVTVSLPASSAVAVTYQATSDWGTGLVGQVTLKNNGTSAIQGWTLQFDTSYAITQIWNASIVGHPSNRYLVQDLGWNATIAPGQSVSFGFTANRNGTYIDPTNFVLNGSPLVPPPPSGVFDLSATYQVTNDWRTGFQGNVTLGNTGTLPIVGWTMEFTFAANITQIWGATILSHVGNRYIVGDAGWNANIAPGGTINFGFIASRADGTSGPAIALMTDVVVNNGDKSKKKTFASIGSGH
ncbi:MAG: cellulose binding domain-containing protein [Isosphaeraceae bacterium]